MNQKLLIILITILNVFVFYIILTKKRCIIKENFQTIETSCATTNFDCSKIQNMEICPSIQGCRVLNDGGQLSCNNICSFNPADADESNYQNFNMTNQVINGTPHYLFNNDEDKGEFGQCYDECLKHHDDDVSDRNLINSHCSNSDCQIKCREYVVRRASEKTNVDRSYRDYPTNRVSEGHYNDVRGEIINMLDNETDTDVTALRNKLQETIFGQSINTELTSQTLLNEKAENLNNVMNTLKELNNTGNSFVQQIDQLGSFQDKYSQKLESLLEGKRGENNVVESNLRRLNDKLSKLDQLYAGFESIDIDKTTSNLKNSVYKSGKCLANSKVLNFTPVKYENNNNDGTTTFNFYKNGAYLINLTNNDGNGNITAGYLFIHPRKLDDNGNIIFCNPNLNDGCKYEHEMDGCQRTYIDANGDDQNVQSVLQINQGENIISPTYPDNTDEQGDFIFKRHGMFNLIEITNNSEYNSIIIKTPNGRNNLVTGDNVKYPFGVIESLERPGFLLNIIKNRDSGYQIKLFPASNRPNEKFKFSIEQNTSYGSSCNGANGCS